jgi:hypothetical protein
MSVPSGIQQQNRPACRQTSARSANNELTASATRFLFAIDAVSNVPWREHEDQNSWAAPRMRIRERISPRPSVVLGAQTAQHYVLGPVRGRPSSPSRRTCRSTARLLMSSHGVDELRDSSGVSSTGHPAQRSSSGQYHNAFDT